MGNPFFDAMQRSAPMGPGPLGMLQRFQQFQQNYHGDPRAQIQQMLNSGQISQMQYNNAVQMAQQIRQIMGGR